MFEADFLDLMPDTCQLQRGTARNDYGEVAVSATKIPIRCRFVRKQQAIRTLEGDERVATGELWLAGVYNVAVSDQVTLPDGVIPSIIRVDMFSDEDGPHHECLYVG